MAPSLSFIRTRLCKKKTFESEIHEVCTTWTFRSNTSSNCSSMRWYQERTVQSKHSMLNVRSRNCHQLVLERASHTGCARSIRGTLLNSLLASLNKCLVCNFTADYHFRGLIKLNYCIKTINDEYEPGVSFTLNC